MQGQREQPWQTTGLLPERLDPAVLNGFPAAISRYEDARPLAAFIERHVPPGARQEPAPMFVILETFARHAAAEGDAQRRRMLEQSIVFGYPLVLAELRKFVNELKIPARLPDDQVAASRTTAKAPAGHGANAESATTPDDAIWLTPNLPWLPESHRSEPAAAPLFQPRRILRRIDDGLKGITLAELFDAEYKFGEYPQDLLEFSGAMLRLVYEDGERLRGCGDPLRWRQADADVQARYPHALRRALELFRSVEPKSHPSFQDALSRIAANDQERQPSEGAANDVAVACIKVDPARRGQANADHVATLVQSIKDGGLINPITITPTGELVSGLHRLLACEAIGMPTVPVFVRDLVGQKKRLAEIDENFVRRQLPALELAELTLERQQIYEALHPETKQYKRGGHAKASKSASASSARPDSFAVDAARKTGAAKRTIQQYTQVARMAPAVRDTVRKTPVASRINDLVALARLPAAEQMSVAKAIADGEAKGVAAARARVAASQTAQLPYPLTEAKKMAAQLSALQRMHALVGETLKEWRDHGHPDMAKYTEYWRGLVAFLDEALVKPPALPTACPCNGNPGCSACGGRGWVAGANPVLTPTSGAARSPGGRA